MLRNRLPARMRLVLGFAIAFMVLEAAAAAFVFWRVQFALDRRLDTDQRSQTTDLRDASVRLSPAAALASIQGRARDAQILGADGAVLAAGPGIPKGTALISPAQAAVASRTELHEGRGSLLSKGGRHVRILALPVQGAGGAAVAVTAVILDQRDEALRELLAQLAIANLITLAIASFVGYRFAHAALDPVERYRTQAERIAGGATGVRLNVPPGPPDEITRLGTTLNAMLDALEQSARRQQQLVDDASHELRTPIAALTAEIELARRKPRTVAEHEEALARVAALAQDLADLAERLLTLGAIATTRVDVRGHPAASLIDAAARRARSQLADGSGRPVVTEAPNEVTINADERLLALALGNLVDNAVRHGAGPITLTAFILPGGTTVSVHDVGTIDPEFLPHAAERFRQGEASRAGAGAGLASHS